MERVDDELWTANVKINTPIFLYKYVLEDKEIYEKGPNRLADLNLLKKAINLEESPTRRSTVSSQRKKVQLDDEWETVYLEFLVLNPDEQQGEQMYLKTQFKDPIKMEKKQSPELWMENKYGVLLRPWYI